MTEQQIVLVQKTWKLLRNIDSGLVGDRDHRRTPGPTGRDPSRYPANGHKTCGIRREAGTLPGRRERLTMDPRTRPGYRLERTGKRSMDGLLPIAVRHYDLRIRLLIRDDRCYLSIKKSINPFSTGAVCSCTSQCPAPAIFVSTTVIATSLECSARKDAD